MSFEATSKETRDRNTLFKHHLDLLEKELTELKIGNIPEDLAEVLAEEVLGSFAVCLFRSFNDSVISTKLARVFVNRFNTPEATSVVMLAYNDFEEDDSNDDAFWENVLKYCRDGNFQAMIDEYYNLLCEGERIGSADTEVNNKVAQKMKNAFAFHTASFKVDTFDDFSKKIRKDANRETNLRSHFAVAFTKTGDDNKNANRKESLRDAFNSPLRPFVLASTSVGAGRFGFSQLL